VRNRSARSSSARSALRVAADEREHGIQAVEEEMRPDPRLQRLQARLGERRRERLREQAEIAEQGGSRHGREHEHARQIALRPGNHAVGQVRSSCQDEHDRDHDCASLPVFKAAQPRRNRGQREDDREEKRLEAARHLHERIGRLREVARGEHGGGERGEVYRQQDARNDAQVAEVGKNVRISVLPYTWHT
jgi:hypothetical protein